MIKIAEGVVHKAPADLKQLLIADNSILERWQDLTPLARNEWICWLTDVRKPETRLRHLVRLQTELLAGKRRPCCWQGCSHR